ncbi:MAG: D-alanine--D-alanine ligase [Spirochaetia bacterium]
MKKKMVIPVLFGGRAPEHSSSIDSASFPITFSDKEKYRIHPVYIKVDGSFASPSETAGKLKEHFQKNRDFLFQDNDPIPRDEELERMCRFPDDAEEDRSYFVENLLSGMYDAVFPIFHGQLGEDGQIQCLLEYAEVPYTGCSAASSVLSNDKEFMKYFYQYIGVPTCRFQCVFHQEWESNPEYRVLQIEQAFSYPMFVKPPNLGSSIGVSKAHNREELYVAVEEAFQYCARVLVEEELFGREISVSVIGNATPLVSVPAEFVYNDTEFFDYQAKYEDQCHSVIPAVLDKGVTAKLKDYARSIFLEMKLSGMSRIDFFVSPQNKIHVLEINTTPSLYTDSTFVMVAEHHGYSKQQLFDELIRSAQEQFSQWKNEHSISGARSDFK